ncbi:hypothetical protein [uncultured Thiodictyon sp.]|uniref:hypothetical protein n=3 Tax=uncultured Thiodictyon sp. TaxID=1846217 RepID=UPI0025D30AD6|nr:hypothetical protein [uncultured Thiodictyon sp.]
MDQSALGALPISLSILVGAIGLVGIVAAWLAYKGIDAERDALRRGSLGLEDVPDSDEKYDYRGWLKERRLDDSHFGDHVRAAADARRSSRAISLQELHQVSARREARRGSARVSGGIAGLLLVCGIAGTLFCIKPVLRDFDITADQRNGETQQAIKASSAVGKAEGGQSSSGPGGINNAKNLIHDLSQAFLPSLWALVLTVIVAMVRGLYTHNRGTLAGELDQLDLEDLFARFPPPSLSRELDGVRAQLADLTAQMLASQRNLDGFVQRLTDAAQGFQNNAPPLQEASNRFVGGVKHLAPRLDILSKTIADHLGPTAPVVSRFDGLLAVATDVNKAAAQMQTAGAILSEHLSASHRLLKDTTDALPAQFQAACQSASGVIAQAASHALATACQDAVARLDAAALPLRDAAQSVAAENRALKADTSQTIANLTRSVEALCDATTKGMRTDLNTGLDAATGRVDSLLTATASQVRASLNDAQQGFREALHVALAAITNLHSSANDAITRVADSVGRLEQVQTRIDAALQASSQTRDVMVEARGDIVAASDLTTEQLANAQQGLADMQQTAAVTAERLAGLTAHIGKLTNDTNTLRPAVETLLRAQQETSAHIETLLKRAEQVSADWQHWLPETTRLHEAGAALHGDLDRLLEQGRSVAAELGGAAIAAADQQQRLARDLETLNGALEGLGRLAGRGLFGRIFGSSE